MKYKASKDFQSFRFVTPLRPSTIALAVMVACVPAGHATELPTVLVEGKLDDSYKLTLDGDSLDSHRITESDLAELLPGSHTAKAGAASGVPTLRGLGDDRVRTLVDGVPVTAACPMHMNPPLSYLSPGQAQSLTVLPGVTPVSLGGDSIGGTIAAQSAKPVFSTDRTALLRAGQVSSIFRSNGSAVELDVDGAVASDSVSLGYQGTAIRSGDYQDGSNERIRASRLKNSNQLISLAVSDGASLWELKAGYQDMPYQGFPNADMDLTKNRAGSLNLLYGGTVAGGHLQASAYFHQVHHEMNGDAPDRYPPSPMDITSMGFMPTRERGADFGYRLEFEMPVTARDTLRFGSEFHGQTLDDRWPGEPMGMMFDYVNLDHATRNHLGTFAEWQRQLDQRFDLLFGVRNDTVWMKTGPVQGYEGIDGTAATFNAGERSKTDVNLDASLIARYRASDSLTYDFGFARKSRSPNLYERYAWGTSTIGMISWFGDGNGYTGDPDLKAEVAHTVSASLDWHDPGATQWQVNIASYYTRVSNYIGVETTCDPACSGMPAVQLQFANHAARLYGAEGRAEYLVANTESAGQFRTTLAVDVVHGQDLTEHTALYRMMPLNGVFGLAHTLGGWQSRIELRMVSAKRQLDSLRLEPSTGGYTITDLRTSYSWRSLRLDAAITNLFDRQYADPLGGRWQSGLYPPGFSGTIPALPGMGRSLDVSITLKL